MLRVTFISLLLETVQPYNRDFGGCGTEQVDTSLVQGRGDLGVVGAGMAEVDLHIGGELQDELMCYYRFDNLDHQTSRVRPSSYEVKRYLRRWLGGEFTTTL